MKKFAFLLLCSALLSATGCSSPFGNEFGSTPAYSLQERGQMIARNWDYEGKQINDDIDMALMLRPMSHLTIWNVE